MGRIQRIPVKVLRPETPTADPQVAEEAPEGDTEWHDLALRLQAERDNYRKRQRRMAQDQVDAERERLLGQLLLVLDDLNRALETSESSTQGLREGVQLTRRAALQRLGNEGVTHIDALGQPFDPHWHEAISAVPHNGTGAAPNTVVKVLEPGYNLGKRLLRPARVVVAV